MSAPYTAFNGPIDMTGETRTVLVSYVTPFKVEDLPLGYVPPAKGQTYPDGR